MQTTLKTSQPKEILFQHLSAFLIKSILFSLVIAASAKISIPMWPVPMTMQPFAILLLGLTLSPNLALGTGITYVIEIMMGLPVAYGFSSGIAYLFGPTGGYIIGFIPVMYVLSRLKNKNMTIFQLFSLCLIGQFILYICGIAWLSYLQNFSVALAAGLAPFFVKIPLTNIFVLFTIKIINQIKKNK